MQDEIAFRRSEHARILEAAIDSAMETARRNRQDEDESTSTEKAEAAKAAEEALAPVLREELGTALLAILDVRFGGYVDEPSAIIRYMGGSWRLIKRRDGLFYVYGSGYPQPLAYCQSGELKNDLLRRFGEHRKLVWARRDADETIRNPKTIDRTDERRFVLLEQVSYGDLYQTIAEIDRYGNTTLSTVTTQRGARTRAFSLSANAATALYHALGVAQAERNDVEARQADEEMDDPSF